MGTARPLNTIVSRLASNALGKDWPLYATLIDHWAEIVGPDLAAQTAPVKLQVASPSANGKNRREHGTLAIRLPRGLAMEMQYRLHVMQERINGYFGYNAITRIVMEHGENRLGQTKQTRELPALDTEERAAIAGQLSACAEGDLKQALMDFGQTLAAARKKQG